MFIAQVGALRTVKEDSASLPPLAIRQAANKTALREIETQKEQFQRLGIMADWSTETTYRTIGLFLSDPPARNLTPRQTILTR